jgi:hypothetical protein
MFVVDDWNQNLPSNGAVNVYQLTPPLFNEPERERVINKSGLTVVLAATASLGCGALRAWLAGSTTSQASFLALAPTVLTTTGARLTANPKISDVIITFECIFNTSFTSKSNSYFYINHLVLEGIAKTCMHPLFHYYAWLPNSFRILVVI